MTKFHLPQKPERGGRTIFKMALRRQIMGAFFSSNVEARAVPEYSSGMAPRMVGAVRSNFPWGYFAQVEDMSSRMDQIEFKINTNYKETMEMLDQLATRK